MVTLFISDLHLDDARPEATDLLLQFLKSEAGNADALYILGDLFEYWLGDDINSGCVRQVAEALASLTERGVPCYFMHGNRDFLIQDNYAAQCGMTLLPEEHVAELYGQQVLLMHGDSLCIDDMVYQQFRNLVRNPDWQHNFLGKSPELRLQIALQARDASTAHKDSMGMGIMDVNQDEVLAAFMRHGVDQMIHGHTHRPAIHDFEVKGNPAQRIVLGDWYTQSSVLRVSPGHYDLVSDPENRYK